MEQKDECRICYDTFQSPHNPFMVPCKCEGSRLYVHRKCHLRWRHESGKSKCKACGDKYDDGIKIQPRTRRRIYTIPDQPVFVIITPRNQETDIGCCNILWLLFTLKDSALEYTS